MQLPSIELDEVYDANDGTRARVLVKQYCYELTQTAGAGRAARPRQDAHQQRRLWDGLTDPPGRMEDSANSDGRVRL